MDAKIVYIFPSKSRPEKFFSTLVNIQSLSAKDNYLVIAAIDIDDVKMNDLSLAKRIEDYKNVIPYYGISTGKIDAINREADKIPADTDIVIVMSDDMVFTEWGFDDIIRKGFIDYFPDYDGCLHFPDQSPVQNNIITLTIIGYKYFKRFGYLYHPDYVSLWADMELTVVAKNLDKYKYLSNSKIFKHAHPLWEKLPFDELMKKNESYYHSDRETYFKRLAKNFDL